MIRFLSRSQAARALGVSESTLRTWQKTGKGDLLPSGWIGEGEEPGPGSFALYSVGAVKKAQEKRAARKPQAPAAE